MVNDYELVVTGLMHMFLHYGDRIAVVEVDANRTVGETVDIALFDSFAQSRPQGETLEHLLRNPRARKVVIYTWDFDARMVETAKQKGVAGYLSKALPAVDLVAALEAIHSGQEVTSASPSGPLAVAGDWPGREEGLSPREAEVLALITQGLSNAEIAAQSYLSPNSVKSYIRAAYRKIGVSRRSQAVVWGLQHGFSPDFLRLKAWQAEA